MNIRFPMQLIPITPRFGIGRILNTAQKTLQPDLFAPWDKDTHGITRFAVIGDPGSGTDKQWDIAKQLEKTYDKSPFASVLVLGDNVYEDGEPHLFPERILKPYLPLFRQQVRFFPIMGNHDVRQGYADQQLTYWGAPNYYRFRQGPVEFFALDTTMMLPGYENCYKENPFMGQKLAETQLEWLEKALKDSKAKFKVVYGHYPIYSSGKVATRSDVTLKLRRMLEPLFVKYGVDLYLAGHEHHYERSKPIKGILHIVSGAAGKLRRIFHKDKAPYPREKAMAKNHFMLFEINKNQLQYQVISKKGNILDKGTILKKHQGKAVS